MKKTIFFSVALLVLSINFGFKTENSSPVKIVSKDISIGVDVEWGCLTWIFDHLDQNGNGVGYWIKQCWKAGNWCTFHIGWRNVNLNTSDVQYVMTDITVDSRGDDISDSLETKVSCSDCSGDEIITPKMDDGSPISFYKAVYLNDEIYYINIMPVDVWTKTDDYYLVPVIVTQDAPL